MSVSALVGENVLFHCNGSGITIVWIVDGSLATDTSITDRGITQDTVTSSGTIQSTLTVPATSVNNGTTVQCRVVSLSGFAISNNATLTVLPGELCWRIPQYITIVDRGIGQVVTLRFNLECSTVSYSIMLCSHCGISP